MGAAMGRRALLPLLIAVAASPASPEEAAIPAPEAAWNVVHEVEGITVYQRDDADSDLKEYKAIGVVDVPAPVLSGVLKDRARYTEFFPYLVENKPFTKDGKHYSYERLDPPLVSERDYTVEHADEDLEGGGLRVRFHDANDAGPAASEDRVRVASVDGMWELVAVDAARTRITYHVHTDPGGSVPMFLVNIANKRGVSSAVQALRDRGLWMMTQPPAPTPRVAP